MRAGALLLLLGALPACRREPERRDRTEPWAAPGVSASASSAAARGTRVRYGLERGSVTLELPARQARPHGTVNVLRAELELDPAAPETTTGAVELDLPSLAMLGDGSDTRDEGRSTRALEWLGLGAGVTPEARESARSGTFLVRSLERRAAGTWLVRGELALNGVRTPKSVEIGVGPGVDAAGAAPERLVIRSVAPLVVSLSTHDIRPRDRHGAPIARELELFGQNVGREARVSFELTLRKH